MIENAGHISQGKAPDHLIVTVENMMVSMEVNGKSVYYGTEIPYSENLSIDNVSIYTDVTNKSNIGVTISGTNIQPDTTTGVDVKGTLSVDSVDIGILDADVNEMVLYAGESQTVPINGSILYTYVGDNLVLTGLGNYTPENGGFILTVDATGYIITEMMSTTQRVTVKCIYQKAA